MESELPDKPSELIRLALKDLEAIEKDDRYVVSMEDWHDPTNGKCYVCLAGAVMARELGANAHDQFFPVDFYDIEEDKLLALDHFRRGEINLGLHYSGISCLPSGVPDFDTVEDYDCDPKAFKVDMHAMADMLEEHGL